MPGNTQNSTALVTEVLAELGVLAAGQPTDQEDFNYVQTRLDPIFRTLNDLNICAIPDPDNIPGQWFQPLLQIVAGECAPKFGSQVDWLVAMKSAGLGGPPSQVPRGYGSAAIDLREMRRGRPTLERLRIEYF
jgi:hypothetical protein